jgi:hypothetical protein
MSAAILTPKGVYIAPTASLKPQAVQIGSFSRQQEPPRENPNLNFT